MTNFVARLLPALIMSECGAADARPQVRHGDRTAELRPRGLDATTDRTQYLATDAVG
jgi:hypothetical protein